ncbi:MAG: hypothetical protein JWR90_1503 [Marmoricola sp.]|nr:hypothetical protein [Marmoricola sp.]
MTRALTLVVILVWWGASAAAAAEPVSPYQSGYEVGATTHHQQSIVGEPDVKQTAAKPDGRVPRYEWRSPCGTNAGGDGQCPQNTCPPGQEIYRLWQVEPPAQPLGLTCSGNGPPPVAAAPPQVSEAMILNAFRRIPLPALRSHSQPADKTLINFDTIFFTEAQPLTRQVTLLGQSVRLEIRPSRFEWVHGDGTTETTSTAGAPYPVKDVVYRYADAHTTVEHRVVVTWSADYSLNGGPLRPVNGTVTTTGPATPLRIAEASPALSGSGH